MALIDEKTVASYIKAVIHNNMIRGPQNYRRRKWPSSQNSNYYDLFYCGTDVLIYIGDQLVDNAVSIQYTLTNNKSPIHGYMSEKFDAVARGSFVVEGQFAIAFTDVNYLGKILENYRIKERSEVSDMETTNGVIRPDRFGYIKSAYNKKIIEGFNIYITYGDATKNYRSFTNVELLNVHITSNTVISQPTGEPIAEIYSFFAQDITNKETGSFFDETPNLAEATDSLIQIQHPNSNEQLQRDPDYFAEITRKTGISDLETMSRYGYLKLEDGIYKNTGLINGVDDTAVTEVNILDFGLTEETDKNELKSKHQIVSKKYVETVKNQEELDQLIAEWKLKQKEIETQNPNADTTLNLNVTDIKDGKLVEVDLVLKR